MSLTVRLLDSSQLAPLPPPPTNTRPTCVNIPLFLFLTLGHASSLPWHSAPRHQEVAADHPFFGPGEGEVDLRDNLVPGSAGLREGMPDSAGERGSICGVWGWVLRLWDKKGGAEVDPTPQPPSPPQGSPPQGSPPQSGEGTHSFPLRGGELSDC